MLLMMVVVVEVVGREVPVGVAPRRRRGGTGCSGRKYAYDEYEG
jgi:hypothetical protein